MKIMRICGVFLCCVLIAGSAQTSLATEKDRISVLEKRVEDLYGQLSSSSPRTDYAIPKLQLRGFAHVQYDYESSNPGTDKNHFSTGGVDLFFISRISSKLTFFNETLFEFGPGGENILDVERVLLKYEYRDWLNISMGRGHTSLGYWNQTFHHGTFLYTTVDRPLLFQFEDDGGILPIHFVGLEVSGNVDVGIGNLNYVANIANGRGEITDSIQLIEDANNDKQLSLTMTLEPDALSGLGIGGNILYDVIPVDPGNPARSNEIQELIMGAHLFYIDDYIEFIGEYQFIDHNYVDQNHSGGYLQLALTFDKIKPYYRFDFLKIDTNDPFFAGLAGAEDIDQHTIGFKYEWFPFAAIKVEYRNLNGETVNSEFLTSQFSFAF